VRDGIPVSTVARTLVDLADVLTERRLADAVHEAEVLRVFDLKAVRASESRLSGRNGRLARVLAAYAEPALTRNEVERRFLELCRSHSLPQPRTNALLHGFEVDFHWPDANLVVEVDGAATHLTRRKFVEDRRRDRALAKKGVRVARVAASDLEGGAADIADILRR
jgi:very-short-patch-repair endonuclease